MQIDKLSGLITWKPETGQEGVHKIVISAKEHKSPTGPLPDGEFTFDVHGQFATQEFEINVFPEHLLNGVPYKEDTFSFLSVPHLTAVKVVVQRRDGVGAVSPDAGSSHIYIYIYILHISANPCIYMHGVGENQYK